MWSGLNYLRIKSPEVENEKWMLAICLMFINEICCATDCFDLAGRDYKIDPDLLRAISWKESRYRVNAIGINPVTDMAAD